MINVERLTEKDYDEVLQVLNRSFTTPTHIADFEKHLPIMWSREHDYMQKHFGVREDGKLIAVIGVYALPVNIAGHELVFSTVGNVGTLQEARGKGCMKAMMDAAMQELERIGADASRLGGLRSRYNRFGYDHAGATYHFELTRRNVDENPAAEVYTFREIAQDDHEGVSFARSCQQRSGIYALRQTHLDFYMSMRAWEHKPYLAMNAKGEPVGYVCAAADGKAIAEQGAKEGVSAVDVLASWLLHADVPQVRFQLSPTDEAVQAAFSICEEWNVEPASMFKIIHWDRVTEALLDLACLKRKLPEGTATVAVKGWGTLEMTVKDQKASVRRTDAPAEITLDHRSATQFLFGPIIPSALACIPQDSLLNAWLPLPLSLNGQDRV